MGTVIFTRPGPGIGREKEGNMNTIKIAFVKDERTRMNLVYANCNNGETYVQPWSELSNEMRMILQAIANPDSCKIEIMEKDLTT